MELTDIWALCGGSVSERPNIENAALTQCEAFCERRGWHCPASVDIPDSRVLYRAVAYWALIQARGVTVHEVSEAFAITHRRASDVLHYIVHEASTSVKSTVSLDVDGGNGRKKVVRVWQIYPHCFPDSERLARNVSGVSRPRRKSIPEDRTIQQLRNWFLSRHLGEMMPDVGGSDGGM
ncbi:CaiF/GrlA family transcriptional regulator [Salmonella enterica]|nr:CaiF/GrlA family transcriptional regulator [Salmonella enterica]ECD4514770.1 CaiF/GrlA family transcriptional regulator [Salmonella enterica subsp. enterica serovar Sandiego]ECF1356168.1 CaiF/GrlA family transcriptional regulator [Salmonella enterica subsp. enterica serovar Sandiego]ECV4068485.1 CaiF/GrlA family transcriptional regulator [Salmonella enterica]ECZ0995782.1 CaiF/GrlA family transcriptional regulator [Salmonella enterica]